MQCPDYIPLPEKGKHVLVLVQGGTYKGYIIKIDEYILATAMYHARMAEVGK